MTLPFLLSTRCRTLRSTHTSRLPPQRLPLPMATRADADDTAAAASFCNQTLPWMDRGRAWPELASQDPCRAYSVPPLWRSAGTWYLKLDLQYLLSSPAVTKRNYSTVSLRVWKTPFPSLLDLGESVSSAPHRVSETGISRTPDSSRRIPGLKSHVAKRRNVPDGVTCPWKVTNGKPATPLRF